MRIESCTRMGGVPPAAVAVILTCFLFFPPACLPQSSSSHSKLSPALGGTIYSWFSLSRNAKDTVQAGLRSLPEFLLNKPLSSIWELDFNLSFDVRGSFRSATGETSSTDARARLYRSWVRLSHARFEARLGLQKINFGSASLFRPLMWFDRLDPRDPLQLTEGVYALLFRYYFQNNTNAWVWFLYGNHDPKGWESSPTASKNLEYGGRLQFPLPAGEAGISFHRRRISPLPGALRFPSQPPASIPENRLGVDGRWDVGVGLWFEAALSHQSDQRLLYPWKKSFSIGGDYTFALGNGLYWAAEYFQFDTGRSFSGADERLRFIGLTMNYPLNLKDALSAVFFFDTEKDEAYAFFYGQKTLQKWSFYMMIFWNPGDFRFYGKELDSFALAGKGIQMMAVYYF